MRKLKENLVMWIILLCFSSVQGQDLYGIFQDENMDWKITSVNLEGEFINEHFIAGLNVLDPLGGSCVDPTKKTMHFVGYDDQGVGRYYAVDLTNGNVIHSPQIGSFFNATELTWNPNDSAVYGLLKQQGSGVHDVVRMNPENGETESIKRLPLVEFSYNAYIDFEENRFVFNANNFDDLEGEFRMYSIDLEDTNQSFDVLCPFELPLYFLGLSYVAGESFSVGLLRDGDLFNHVDNVAQLDNSDGSVSIVSELTGIEPLNFEIIYEPSLGMVFIGNYVSDEDSVSRIMATNIQTGVVTSDAQLPHRLRVLEYIETEVGIDESSMQKGSAKLWPLPARDQVQVSSNKEVSSYTICDMKGQIIAQGRASGKQFSFDVSSFSSGVYNVFFLNDKGLNAVSKLIVR